MQSEDLRVTFPFCFLPPSVITEHGGDYDRDWEFGRGKGMMKGLHSCFLFCSAETLMSPMAWR